MGIFDKVLGRFDKGGFGGASEGASTPGELVNRVPVRPDGVFLVEQDADKRGFHTVIGGYVNSGSLFSGQKAKLGENEIILRSIEVKSKPVLYADAGSRVVLKVTGAEPAQIPCGSKLNFNKSV